MSDPTQNPTAQEPVPVTPPEETPAATQTDTTEGAPSQDSEYEAKLRQVEEEKSKITEERDNLKVALGQSRDKQKAEREAVNTPTPPETGLTAEQVRSLVDEMTNDKVQTIRTDIAVASFDKIIGELTSNPKEDKLIRHHYKHTVKASGIDERSIRNDLLIAKAAANVEHLKFGNQPKFDTRLSSAMSMSGGKDSGSITGPTVDLTDKDKKMLNAFGVDQKTAAQRIQKERDGR